MSYDLNSPLSPYVAPSGNWYASRVLSNAYGGESPIIEAYTRWCTAYGIDANLALAQACHEATYFTSDRWKNEWNPAGLGITADNTPPNPFTSLDEGIRAHVEHLCCHAYTAKTCPVPMRAVDRRHTFHRGELAIQDIQKAPYRWAAGVPGGDPLDYVRSIVSIANTVAGDAPAPQPANGGTVDRPNIIPNHTSVNVWNAGDWPGRDAMPVRALVLHVMAGSYAGSINWFHNPASNASANYCVSYEGEITETVDPDTQAPWANGILDRSATALPPGLADLQGGIPNANWVTVSIETEGLSPFQADYPTPAERDAVVTLMAYLCGKYALTPSTDTIVRHTAFDTRNRPNCPGPHWDMAQLAADVTARMGGTMSDYKLFTETNHGIGGGFRQFFEQHGGIPIFGLPLSEERQEKCADGVTRTVQYFERNRFEYHPEHQGTGNEVQLTRYGAMALKAAGEHGAGIDN